MNVFRDDGDRHSRVVENVVAHAAQDAPLQNPEAPGSHDDLRTSVAIHAEDDHLTWIGPVFRMHTAWNLREPLVLWDLVMLTHRYGRKWANWNIQVLEISHTSLYTNAWSVSKI